MKMSQNIALIQSLSDGIMEVVHNLPEDICEIPNSEELEGIVTISLTTAIANEITKGESNER